MSIDRRRKYSDEFKIRAVQLGESIGYSRAANQLGVSFMSLKSWSKNDLGKKKLTEAEQIKADREELKRLRKENAEQKDVILILKKAAAFFSNDQLK